MLEVSHSQPASATVASSLYCTEALASAGDKKIKREKAKGRRSREINTILQMEVVMNTDSLDGSLLPGS